MIRMRQELIQVRRHLYLLFACTVLFLFLPVRALSQNWSGSVQCTLSEQDQTYVRQETQTWTLTGGGPISPNGLPTYAATWSVTGQGQLQRAQGAQTTNIQWTTNVPPQPTTISIFVRASDNRLIILPRHTQLRADNATTGARQVIVNGVAQQPTNISHTVWEWQFPHIEASPTDTTVTGSTQSQADAGDAELRHRYGGLPPSATCQWQFTNGLPTPTPATSNLPGVGNGSTGGPTPPNPQGSNTNPTSGNQNCPTPAQVQQSFDAMKADLATQYDKLIQASTDPVEIGSLTNQKQKMLANLNTQEQHDMQQANSGCSGTPSAGGSQNQPGAANQGSTGSGSPQTTPPPTNVTATAGDSSATISWTAPNLPAGTSVQVYRIGPASGGGSSTTSHTSPVTISGLINGTSYTFQVVAISNLGGAGAYSAPAVSNAVIPAAPGTLNPSGPSITSINPNQGVCNANNSFQLNAQNTHFVAGTTTADFGPGVQQKALNVVSPQQLFAHLFIHGGATPGLHTVTITTGAEVVKTTFTVTTPCTSNSAPDSIQSMTPNTGAQGAQNIPVQLTADANTYLLQGMTTADFGPGITATLAVNSPSSATAYLNIAPTAAIGPHDVTLNTSGELTTLPQGFTVTTAAGSPAPGGSTVTALCAGSPPASIGDSGPQVFAGVGLIGFGLQGQNTHWASGATTMDAGSGITVSSLTVANATSLSMNLQVDLNSPQFREGKQTITVTTTTPTCKEVVAFNDFYATKAPVITGVSPASAPQGAQNVQINLTGDFTSFVPYGAVHADFGPGTHVITPGAPASVGPATIINSSTSATTLINIDSTAAVGPRDVYLAKNLEGNFTTLHGGFSVTSGMTVTPLGPTTITLKPSVKITPDTINRGKQLSDGGWWSMSLQGQLTHWTSDTTKFDFGTGIHPAGALGGGLHSVSPTSATGMIVVAPNVALGAHPFTVTVPLASGDEVATGTLMVTEKPTVSQVSPSQASQGAQNFQVTLTGFLEYFSHLPTKADFGPGITVVPPLRLASSTVIAVLNVDPSAPTGAHDITLATDWDQVKVPGGFTVTPGFTSSPIPVPITINMQRSITQISSADAPQGTQKFPVTLTGANTHFVQGTSIVDFGPGITVKSPTVTSANSITALLFIDAAATIGPRDIKVTTGTETATLSQGFNVSPTYTATPLGPQTITLPAVTQVSPNSAASGGPTLGVTITGNNATHFSQSTKADFGQGVTVGPLTFTPPNTIKANLTITAGATAGSRTVTLTTGTEVAKLANGFTVTTTPSGGTYQILITGFHVNHQVYHNPVKFDGGHDNVYGAAAVEVLDRSNNLAVLQSVSIVSSAVHGDISQFPQRIQAGTATNQGGLQAGDVFPTGQNPGAVVGTPSTTTFPLLVWQGTLRNGIEAVVIRPTLWESFGQVDGYAKWRSNVVQDSKESSTIQGKITSNDLTPFQGQRVAFADDDAFMDDMLHSEDRPIGMLKCDPTHSDLDCWCNRTMVVTREAIEQALSSSYQTGGIPQGTIDVHLTEDTNALAGDYDLYLRVVRISP